MTHGQSQATEGRSEENFCEQSTAALGFGRSFQVWQVGCQDLGSGESPAVSLTVPSSWTPSSCLPALLESWNARTSGNLKGDVPGLRTAFLPPSSTYCLGTRRANKRTLQCGRGMTSQRSPLSAKFNKSYSFALPCFTGQDLTSYEATCPEHFSGHS